MIFYFEEKHIFQQYFQVINGLIFEPKIIQRSLHVSIL
jgi:hypothetical protein